MGVISYVIINVVTGKAKEKKISVLMYVLAVLFILNISLSDINIRYTFTKRKSPAEASFYFYNLLSLFISMMYNYESVYSFSDQ